MTEELEAEAAAIEVENGAENVTEEMEAEEGEDLVVTLGDAEPEKEEKAPAWVKDLRAQHKEQARRLRELEEENRTLKAPQGTQAVGAKPTLESCDYDETKFERDLTAWHEAKRKVEAEKQARIDAEAAEKKAWQDKLNSYEESKKELKIADFEDAEGIAQMRLNTTQQGIILHGLGKDAAKMMYALGANPVELDRMAAIDDPVQFAIALGELRKTMKTTSRKAPPAPEKQPPDGGKSAGATDNTLERLRAEAVKTGNFTKVLQYKAEQKAKQK